MKSDDENTITQHLAQRSKLYSLLYKKLPNHRAGFRHPGHLSGMAIGKDLNVSHQTFYKWCNKDKLPARHVTPLTELDGSQLTVEDLIPFVI